MATRQRVGVEPIFGSIGPSPCPCHYTCSYVCSANQHPWKLNCGGPSQLNSTRRARIDEDNMRKKNRPFDTRCQPPVIWQNDAAEQGGISAWCG